MVRMRIVVLWSSLFIVFVLVSCDNHETKRTHFKTGQVESEYQVKDGLRDGFARTYYEDGSLKFEGAFKGGLRDGWHVLYYVGGGINQKTFYTNANGAEQAKTKLRYNKQGELISDFSFVEKRISLEVKNQTPYYVNDTLFMKIKIEDAKHSYCEAVLGHFDSNLNVLRAPEGDPITVSGNENHEIIMRVQLTKPGKDTLTWIVRDFDFKYKTDSTGTSFGENAYLAYPIEVKQR